MTMINLQGELPQKAQLDLLDVALFVRAAALSNLSAAGREFGCRPPSQAPASPSSNASLARGFYIGRRGALASRRKARFSPNAPARCSTPPMPRAPRSDARSNNRKGVCV